MALSDQRDGPILYYVEEGSFAVQVGAAAERTLATGEQVVVSADVPYTVRNVGAARSKLLEVRLHSGGPGPDAIRSIDHQIFIIDVSAPVRGGAAAVELARVSIPTGAELPPFAPDVAPLLVVEAGAAELVTAGPGTAAAAGERIIVPPGQRIALETVPRGATYTVRNAISTGARLVLLVLTMNPVAEGATRGLAATPAP